jgi:parvulin-like peptidyl-prolyl isomerase
MTFRARPVTRPVRRLPAQDDHRQRIVVRFGFIALPIVAVLILAGVAGSSYYADHLTVVASVDGTGITRDQWAAQQKVDAFRYSILERRIAGAQAAGQLDQATAQQDLQYVKQQIADIPAASVQELIDRVLQEKLAAQMGITVSGAEVDAQLAKEATTVEQRKVLAIIVTPGASPAGGAAPGGSPAASGAPAPAAAASPVPSAGTSPAATKAPAAKATATRAPATKAPAARTPAPSATPSPAPSAAPAASPGASPGTATAAEEAQARSLADQALAQLQAGTPFDQVARAFSTDASATSGGDYGYITATDPVDPAWVAALFALPAGGMTGVMQGADGTFRIGRVTAIVPAATDPRYQQELAQAGVSLAAYRDAIRGDLIRQKLAAKVLTDATTGSIEQVHAREIRIASGDTATARLQAIQQALAQPGADFAAVARVNSDSPDADSGGDMGWIAPYQLAPAVQDVLFGLKVGQVSRPVVQSDGIYLYLVSERAQRPVDATQRAALAANAFTNWYTTQRAKAGIWRSPDVPAATPGQA